VKILDSTYESLELITKLTSNRDPANNASDLMQASAYSGVANFTNAKGLVPAGFLVLSILT